MGGEPLTALNLVAYSLDELGGDVLREILRGGARRRGRARASAIVGGHSIDDPEPKYGLAVTGAVHPDRAGAQLHRRAAGHDLYLTKPVGGGVASTAAKRGLAADQLVQRADRCDDHAEPRRRRAGARRRPERDDRRDRLRPARAPARAGAGERGGGRDRRRRGPGHRRRARPAARRRAADRRGHAAATASGWSRSSSSADGVPEELALARLRRDDLRRAAGGRRARARARRAPASAGSWRASRAG